MTAIGSTGYPYAVGAAALGGISYVSGATGGLTVFSGTTIIGASGGLGGMGSTDAVWFAQGGSGAPVGYSGDITATGENGFYGMFITMQDNTSTQIIPGGGGNAGLINGGALPVYTNSNGNNARFNAGGGGGAYFSGIGRHSGGSGGQGLLIIDEYS